MFWKADFDTIVFGQTKRKQIQNNCIFNSRYIYFSRVFYLFWSFESSKLFPRNNTQKLINIFKKINFGTFLVLKLFSIA